MTSTINVTQVGDNLSEILGRVKFGEEIVTIEKKGKPYAVIISPSQYEAMQKAAREQFGVIMRKIQTRNAKFNTEEVMRDVTEEVEAVRRENHERRK